MKRVFRSLSSLLLVLAVLLGMGIPALAADTSGIAYRGHKKITIYPATTVYTGTDLFGNFKDVMPGDKLTEEIKITNWALDSDYVKVYMQAIPNHLSGSVAREETAASMKDFLSQLYMTIHKGTKAVYSASPDETAQLTDRVYLGSLRRGRSMTLDVELTVPATLGNDYANRKGEVDWVFTFEGCEDSTPKTGDTIMTPAAVMAVAAAGLVLLILGKKKKNKNV